MRLTFEIIQRKLEKGDKKEEEESDAFEDDEIIWFSFITVLITISLALCIYALVSPSWFHVTMGKKHFEYGPFQCCTGKNCEKCRE